MSRVTVGAPERVGSVLSVTVVGARERVGSVSAACRERVGSVLSATVVGARERVSRCALWRSRPWQFVWWT